MESSSNTNYQWWQFNGAFMFRGSVPQSGRCWGNETTYCLALLVQVPLALVCSCWQRQKAGGHTLQFSLVRQVFCSYLHFQTESHWAKNSVSGQYFCGPCSEQMIQFLELWILREDLGCNLNYDSNWKTFQTSFEIQVYRNALLAHSLIKLDFILSLAEESSLHLWWKNEGDKVIYQFPEPPLSTWGLPPLFLGKDNIFHLLLKRGRLITLKRNSGGSYFVPTIGVDLCSRTPFQSQATMKFLLSSCSGLVLPNFGGVGGGCNTLVWSFTWFSSELR